MGEVEKELGILREALSRYSLLGDQDMDVSVLASEGRAVAWPDAAAEKSVAELGPARRAAYAAAPAARVVLGLETAAAREVAQLPQGLRPLAQSGAYFYGTLASVGTADEAEEALKSLQTAVALGVRDEGKFYILAGSVGAAFTLAYYLNKACCRQLLIGAHPAVEPQGSVWEHARSQSLSQEFGPGIEWPAIKAWIRGEQPAPQAALAARAGEALEGETKVRQELSAAHKELNRRGLDELIWNHISAKLPGGGDGFLITAGDRLWSLMEPETLLGSSENCTADILHSAVYKSVPSAGAVVHTHSRAIEAVSCLQAGLLEPAGSDFAGRVAYHDWEGISDDWEECDRVAAAIGAVPKCAALIMKNHGAITFGDDLAEAIERHLALDAACRDALMAMAEGKPSAVLEALCSEPLWAEHRPRSAAAC